jgi:myxalamid-type polyketide synthase MxaE and MxaD
MEKVTQEKSLQTSAHLPEIFLNPEALTLDPENFYGSMEKRGILYGPAFRGVQQLWRLEQDVLGSIELPEMLAHQTDPYRMHPALMDACLQVVAGLSAPEKDHELYLPAGCHSIQLYSRPGQQLYCKVSPLPETSKERLEADIRIYDKQGKLIAELLGFRLRRAQTHKTKSTAHQDTWLYQLHWKKQSTHSFVPKQNGTKRHWLVFADSEGVAAALVNELEKSGDSFEVLPAEVCKGKKQEEVQQLVEAFAGSPTMQVYGIIHLWSLSIPSQSWGTEDDHEALGCNSVLYLVQTLAKRFTASARLWLVTCGAQAMKEGETVAVEQSPMWGLGKAISFELPELKCVRLDLDPGASTAYQGNSLFQQLHYDDTEDQVAIRGEDRFVLRIIPYAPMVAAVGEMVLRPDRTYLITGGLGALGLVTAARMVYRGARYLVLTGRRDAGKNAQAAITHMRQQGATVVAYKVDVSAYAEMKTLFETLEREMPPLAGVVHAAGVLDDASLLNLNAGRMKTVMAPKVSGTWNLHRLTARNPLDFFVLYSSAVSVLGSPGQGNYAAASAYLDAMAQYRRSLGLPAISINWGPWADIGLAAEALGLMDKQAAATQHLIKVIDVEKGLDILEQLILDAPVGAAVLPFNLKHLLELYPAAAGMTFFEEAGGSETHVARLYARPNLQQPYVAPRTEIERKMAELWQQTLHIERVGIHDSFFELGGDSVLAAQILSLARKNYGLSIPTQEAFKAFTIERLAELLEAEIIKAIDAMSEEEAENRMAENN